MVYRALPTAALHVSAGFGILTVLNTDDAAGRALSGKRRVMRMLIISHDPPYGSERPYQTLRLTDALLKVEKNVDPPAWPD